jgi:kanosamine 6-kinase
VLLGVDVGGTKVAVRLERDGRSAEHAMTWPAACGVRDDLAALRRWLDEVLAGQPAPRAVGVAMPATCDAAGTVVTWPGRPAWVGLPLAAALRTVLGDVPIAWADDGDLAALAEAEHAGRREVLYLGIGTGVGGGIVRDGRIWPGPERGSCELGHLVVDLSGPRCDCGRRGCVQALASGPATLRLAAELRGAPVTPADLAAGVAGGAGWAGRAVDRGVAALAAAVVGVGELAHPDLVLIGGGFGAGLAGLPERVAAAAESLRRPGGRVLDVRPAALGARSSLAGAVLLARQSPKNSR